MLEKIREWNGSLELNDLAVGAKDISTRSSEYFGNLVCSIHTLYLEVGMQILDGSRDDFGYYIDKKVNLMLRCHQHSSTTRYLSILTETSKSSDADHWFLSL